MSSNSFLVDLRKSMIIANPQHFPMNMEKPTKEDYPVETYPIVAYDAKNVMPTPFGYKSFFEESTRLNIGNLTGKFVQRIFNYQTVNMDSVQFALCEDGIYVAFATEPTPANWARIVDLSATMVTGIRRLWTVAVISNVVYLYQAGQPKFWAIVDPAKYAEAASPSLIAGATRSQVWTNWATGLISYIPSFLNMAGQIGLFRADNRLGFWDSDNSVGWSSSVAIEDFKPDAKTFAGSTKFADVQGRIVKILGSGDNFVIYATRSIVNCIGLDNSPEKWRGEAIMSEVGVAFDSQIAAAQPDQIHYCITQAGLCAITAGSPEYIATEVMDYIAETFPLYSLTVIEGRYLFISVNGSFPGSEYGTESVELIDYNNNKYIFPRPTYPQLEDLGDYLEEALAGRNGETQGSFKDYEPIVDTGTIPPAQPLEPCYDIKTFESTWADTTFTPTPTGNYMLASKLMPGVQYHLTNYLIRPTVTNNSIYTNSNMPGDWAGQDIIDKLDQGMTKFNAQLAYQNAMVAANAAPISVSFTKPLNLGNFGYTLPEPVTWDKEFLTKYQLNNCLLAEDLKVKANECRVRLYADGDRTARLKSYVAGTETPISGIGFVGVTGHAVATDYGQYITKYGGDPIYVSYPVLPELVSALAAYSPGKENTEIAGLWAMWLYPEKCISSIGTVPPVGPPEYQPAYGIIFPVPAMIHWMRTELNAIYVQGDTSPGMASRWPSSPALGGGVYDVDFTLDGFTFQYGSPTTGYAFPEPIMQDMQPKYLRMATSHGRSDASAYALDEFRQSLYPGLTSNSYYEAQIVADFIITAEVDYDTKYSNEYVIYEAELSGWGYTPHGGFSFRKTHNRHSSTTCPYPGAAIGIAPPDNMIAVKLPPLDRPELNNPGYVWDYPDSIPLPPNYALFQKGSLGAYYPTYGAAAVYDLLLQKWGMYNNSHKLIQELMPVNRVDSSIMPVLDKGMFAGALNPASECTVFKDLNPQSRITYGKMAFYRRGMSLATEAIAHFGTLATGTLIVEASMDGVTVDPLLSYAVPFVNQRNVTLPFTTRAKWFNIRVEGNFNLTYLELLAESRGRR